MPIVQAVATACAIFGLLSDDRREPITDRDDHDLFERRSATQLEFEPLGTDHVV
jgi:hypothetical protein